jgi:hypothetical protein
MPFVYDKSKGQRFGGAYTISEDGDELVFTFCKPNTDAILSISAERSALESKIVVFSKKLQAAVWEKDDKPLRLEIGRADLLPIAEFVADHVTALDGLADPDGNALTVDDLEREHLIDICLRLEAKELLLLAGAVKDSAGLREDVKGKSSTSSESSGTAANAPGAPA